MTKVKSEWVAPIFLVVAIFAVYLALTYLPLSDWGISISVSSLWLYAPWLVAFAVGLYALKTVYRGKH